ncbi:uncharacterized protein AAEQ78_010273 isoform 1-T1 [Lycaon pictus]
MPLQRAGPSDNPLGHRTPPASSSDLRLWPQTPTFPREQIPERREEGGRCGAGHESREVTADAARPWPRWASAGQAERGRQAAPRIRLGGRDPRELNSFPSPFPAEEPAQPRGGRRRVGGRVQRSAAAGRGPLGRRHVQEPVRGGGGRRAGRRTEGRRNREGTSEARRHPRAAQGCEVATYESPSVSFWNPDRPSHPSRHELCIGGCGKTLTWGRRKRGWKRGNKNGKKPGAQETVLPTCCMRGAANLSTVLYLVMRSLLPIVSTTGHLQSGKKPMWE